MSLTSSINPRVLRWARETSGLSLHAAAQKLKRKRISAETIAAWESGEASPSYAQLEALAYAVYKRPLALFFFPEPPAEETPRQAFRTLPESEIKRMSPGLHLLLRRARAMQLNLGELYGGADPAARSIVRDSPFNLDRPVADLAVQARAALGIELAEQLQWPSADTAFKAWRRALEDAGVYVFKDAFKDESISGFCVHDERYPLIYVNNSKPATRQVFTLFHELAHLLSGTGGIDTRDDRYIDALQGRDRQVELLCDRFASAFLVPDADFAGRIAGRPVDDDLIRTVAEQYSVSREVVARRLLDHALISKPMYDKMVGLWRTEATGRTGSGGDYYRNQGVYLGERYLELAFRRLYQKQITADQLADYLGVKPASVAGMEALLYTQGAVG